MNQSRVKHKECHRVHHKICLPSTNPGATTLPMSSSKLTTRHSLPKVTVQVGVWMDPQMKEKLDEIRRERAAKSGHRLTLADLGREAFLRFLEREGKITAAPKPEERA